jgi:hypothetical protein
MDASTVESISPPVRDRLTLGARYYRLDKAVANHKRRVPTLKTCRRGLDGRAPTRLAVLPRTVETGLGPTALTYFDGDLVPTLIVGEARVVKLWIAISRKDPAESLLLLQGARLQP